MANPRQRRKARSGKSTGPSANAKREMRKKLDRSATVRGPDVLKAKWDPKLTARQNYAAMGLVGDLRLRDSGGNEHHSSSTAIPAEPERRATGRIERDADGTARIVDDLDEREAALAASTPWGRPMNAIGPREEALHADEQEEEDEGERSTSEEVDALSASQTRQAPASVVKELEQLAASVTPVPRHQSLAERSWLQRLVDAHGDDVEAMAHNAKLNVWQKTQGEIRRAIKKAGGVEAVRSS